MCFTEKVLSLALHFSSLTVGVWPGVGEGSVALEEGEGGGKEEEGGGGGAVVGVPVVELSVSSFGGCCNADSASCAYL